MVPLTVDDLQHLSGLVVRRRLRVRPALRVRGQVGQGEPALADGDLVRTATDRFDPDLGDVRRDPSGRDIEPAVALVPRTVLLPTARGHEGLPERVPPDDVGPEHARRRTEVRLVLPREHQGAGDGAL